MSQTDLLASKEKEEDHWIIPASKIKLGKEIGKGSFGRVFKAEYLGTEVCCKELINSDLKDEFEHEVKMLKSLRHPLVVLFMGIAKDSNSTKFIVQEFVNGGSLLKVLQNKRISISWLSRIKMALEISQAISYLHEKNCLHRDLKCENVLIDCHGNEIDDEYESTFRCKVADFGLATILDNKNSGPLEEVGAPWWRAPEVSTRNYNEKADVFSFGVVLLEIITRDLGEDIRINMTYQIKQKNGLYFGVKPENLRKEYEDRVKDCPTELFDTALSCCNEDPTLRPSMEKNLTTIQKLYNNYNNFITISHSKIFNKEGSELWVNLLTKDYSTNEISVKILVDHICNQLQLKTGRNLTPSEKQFLIKRFPNEFVTVDKFDDFWRWYFPIGEMISFKKMLPLWKSSFICGFISKNDTITLLKQQNTPNTFIVRFSESQSNSISIAYMDSDETIKHLLIRVDPNGFIFSNTKYMSLQQLIMDCFPFLKFVHPDKEWNGKDFHNAHLETEKLALQDEIKSFTNGYEK